MTIAMNYGTYTALSTFMSPCIVSWTTRSQVGTSNWLRIRSRPCWRKSPWRGRRIVQDGKDSICMLLGLWQPSKIMDVIGTWSGAYMVILYDWLLHFAYFVSSIHDTSSAIVAGACKYVSHVSVGVALPRSQTYIMALTPDDHTDCIHLNIPWNSMNDIL